jgi:SAM-dependent methyltransferase
MIPYLKQRYKEQSFNPGLLGLLINPFFHIRSSIYKGIKNQAPKLQGALLDFGCGSKAYKHLFTVDSYIGLDVEQSGHSHENEEVDVFYDGTTIPFDNETFDSCFSSEVFEHVFELEYSLQEIHRVLKPNGHGLFVVPFVWDEHEVPYDYGRYASFGLHYLLEKSGFEIVESHKDSHFFLVIIQLWNLFLFNLGPQKNKYLRLIYGAIIIAPFTLIGYALSWIAPKINSLYFNNIVLVRKKG